MRRGVAKTRAQLLRELDTIRAGVESGRTREGSIEFTLPDDGEPVDFMVLASYWHDDALVTITDPPERVTPRELHINREDVL